MKKSVACILVSILLIVGTVMAGCGKSNQSSSSSTSSTSSSSDSPRIAQIKKAGKLVLATGDYRPFEYRDEKTNKMIGYDIDIANAVAKKLGVKLEANDMEFASLIPTLQNGQADLVIGALYITDERKKVVDMSDSYLATGQAIATRKDVTNIKSVDDLEGKTVGAKVGSSSEKAVNDLIKSGKKITLKSYKTNEECLLDVASGRLDATVDDYLYQVDYNKTHPNIKIVGDPFVKADLGVAVKKGDTELLKVVNEVLKDLEKSGEKDKMYKKWISGGK